MKKTPLTHSSKEEDQWLLPLIKIVSTEDEMFTKLNLEMEDSTHDMLVKWGKERATDEDYISVALRCGLEEYLDSIKEKS
jgi:hypothetical protein